MRCEMCKRPLSGPCGVGEQAVTFFCRSCLRNMYLKEYDFDKNKYRGLAAPTSDLRHDFTDDPEEKKKDDEEHMKPYNLTVDAGMKKTNKIVRKGATRNYDNHSTLPPAKE